MGFGVHQVFQCTIASGAASGSFNAGRAFGRMMAVFPSCTSSQSLDVYASTDGTTYYQLRKDGPGTSYIVAATALANGGIVPLPVGLQYVKVISDAAIVNGLAVKVICSDEV